MSVCRQSNCLLPNVYVQPSGITLAATSRNTVLVIDNDDVLGHAIKTHLEQAGYQVDIATAGKAALVLIDERQPKLVITDLQMPGMDGIDLLRRARDQRLKTTV